MASRLRSRWMAANTWTAPVRVNQAPQTEAFSPAVGVAADGTVAVVYYDLRNDTPDPSALLANYWCIQSRDGGNTWSETAVSGPFNYLNAPLGTLGNSLFLGDYQGMVASGKTFLTLFPVTKCKGQAFRNLATCCPIRDEFSFPRTCPAN